MSYIAREVDFQMVLCDLPTFRRHYLPAGPSEDEISAALPFLLRSDCLRDIGGDDYRWAELMTYSACGATEDVVFAPLTNIFEALARYGTDSGRKCNFRYLQHPGIGVPSKIGGGGHRINGSFSLTHLDAEKVCERSEATADIAVSVEFKRKSTLSNARDVSETSCLSFICN